MNGNSTIPKRTQFLDVLEDKFLAHDPLVARILISVGKGLKSLVRSLCCLKSKDDSDSRMPKATSNSSLGMLTLSIHMNHLVTWICTVFSVAVTASYIAANQDFNLLYYIGILTGVNSVISCITGFFISSYLIKKLEESLSDQILTIFFTSSDR